MCAIKCHEPILVRRMLSAPAVLSSKVFSANKTVTCPICCEKVHASNLHIMEEFAGAFHSACSCEACTTCIQTWVELQLPQCVRAQILRIPCFGGCNKTLPQKIVLQTSERARTLASNLQYRWDVLERNPFYPSCMQVECRNAECVGIGYSGFETIMCMVCELQWEAVEQEVSFNMDTAGLLDGEARAQGFVLAYYMEREKKFVGLKRCPKCSMLIEKTGGCDHMTCRACKHEWWWTNGKPFRQ